MERSYHNIKTFLSVFVLSFILTECTQEPPAGEEQTLPKLTTGDVTDITTTTASCQCNVTSDGGAAVTARGVCWSTAESPTTAGSKTTDGSGIGSFTGNLTNLTPNTKYYMRAYATNAKGTAYGVQRTFNTLQEQSLATVTTGDISDITTTTAKCAGKVILDGGAAVTARGICWSTAENPGADGSKTSNGTGTGEFSGSLTELNPNTTYYVRAYAVNSKGTAYGVQKTFTTLQGQTKPAVTTGDITNITATTATCSGNVTSDGGTEVTARGICWSTAENPGADGSKTSDGTGTGPFSGDLTNLTPNTTYYIRAYATNSEGTAYGEQKSFVTKKDEAPDTFKDNRDEKVYKTVTLGKQVWMAENLAYLPSVSPPTEGESDVAFYYVYGYYGTDVAAAKETENYKIYGVLYNWPAAMSACPDGWHLPSNQEWLELINFAGGIQNAGGYLKEAGTEHWREPNEKASNYTGFTGLPGGSRGLDGDFINMFDYGNWWMSTQQGLFDAMFLSLRAHHGDVTRPILPKRNGFSVRCLKDK